MSAEAILRLLFRRSLVCGILAIIGTASAFADDRLELRHGGSVSGPVRSFDDGKLNYHLVELSDGIRVAIPNGEVARKTEHEELAQYRENFVRTPDLPEAQFELSRWCKSQGLRDQAEFHLRRVVQLDPNHATAREALNFVRDGRQWIPRPEWERKRGLVRSGGRYYIPEDLAVQESRDQANRKSKRWVGKIARLRAAVLRGGEASAEALQELKAIEDPLAVPAIAEELTGSRSKNQPVALRLLWIDLLSKFKIPAAVEPLVRLGVKESDAVIREAALEKLSQHGRQSAILSYAPMLKSPNNREVNQAGRALTFLPEPELRFQLVDALVTKHVKTSKPQSEMNVMMGRGGGGGGLQMGGKPKVETEFVRNPQVLAALREIAPEVDFNYNQDRWRLYFANQLGSYSGDLRRDSF